MSLYNEIDGYASRWLANLIDAGHIAPGRVDTRSIAELRPDDVRGAVQFHTFAGIGVWSYALRLAGWPDDASVWTGSCPCQPFSTAGRGAGFDDARHLWPAWFELIRECRPPVVLGEQVASRDGLVWLDAVSADLEGAGYAVGAADLCAAGVGAPHIRQRLYFVGILADADGAGSQGRRVGRDGADERAARPDGVVGDVADADMQRGERRTGEQNRRRSIESDRCREARDVGHADGIAAGRDGGTVDRAQGQERRDRAVDHGPRDAGAVVVPGPCNGPWADAEWIACTDGKSRPAQPGSFPLAHGTPARMGRDGAMEARSRVGELRGYGNAIVAEVAATWIRCVMAELGMVRS